MRKPGGWVILAAICVAVVAADLLLAHRSTDFIAQGTPPAALASLADREQPYNLLVRGLEKGHVYLDKAVPAGLATLPNPYDSGANGRFRDEDNLFDLSYYQGRLYLYFGVTPALTAFLPWHLLTGNYLSEWLAVAGFSAFGFLVSACILALVWRGFFPEVSWGYVAAGLLMLAATTTVPVLLARPRFWEVPVSCSYAFLMAGVAAGWLACRRRRGQAGLLALAGLCAGLAVGARPSALPAAVALAALAAFGAWGTASPEANGGGMRLRALARTLAAAFLPLVIVGACLGIYNFERFGDGLQFGQHYQLSSDNVHGRATFSTAFLPDNIRLYALSALRWGPHFPFAWTPDASRLAPGHGTVEFVVGILPNMPVLLLALAAPLAWAGRPGAEARPLRRLAGGLALLFAIQATVLGLFYGLCNRYEVDFLPFLALIACLGLLGAVRALAPARTWVRRAFAAGLAILCAYSCVTVGCAALAWGDFNRCWNLAQLLIHDGTPAQAIPAWREQIRISQGAQGFADLGNTEIRAGRVSDAIPDLTEAVRQNPDNWMGHAFLGIALSESGNMSGSLQQLREAHRLSPDSVAAEVYLGLDLLKAGEPDEAVPFLEEAVRHDPQEVQAHRLLGRTYLLAGRTTQALAHLKAALALSPGDPAAEDQFGLALLQAGDRPEAIRHFEAALHLDPGYASAREHLAGAESGSRGSAGGSGP